MAGILIDARIRFVVARCAAIAKRSMAEPQPEHEAEWLESELREAMRSKGQSLVGRGRLEST